MLKVEFLSYRISRLDMLNKPEVAGEVELSDKMEFFVDFKSEDNLAVAELTEHLKMLESDKFYIKLTLEGFFHVEGITSDKLKKEAYMRCYDCLFPYVDQLLRMLSVSSGMGGEAVEKRALDLKNVHIGNKPKDAKDGKVIDFQPDTDR